MLAAGTMITVRKRQMEEHLGLTAEMRAAIPANEEEDADVAAVPAHLQHRQKKNTVVTHKNSVASIVTKSKAQSDAASPWRHNKVLRQLEKTVEDDTTLVFIESLRDKAYFTFQGIPSRVVLCDPWPALSTAATLINLIAVAVSCFVLCLSTVPEVAAVHEARVTLFAIETVTIIWFILDYAVRFGTSRIRAQFFIRPANLLDLLTILPYFVEITSGADVSALAAFRIIRLTRVMRLARLSRTSGGLRDVITALKNSGSAMSLLIFLLAIALTIASTSMYYAEQLLGAEWDAEDRLWIRADGHISPFQSIYHAMWWCIVTMTTVGYGDDVPVNGVGKAVGVVTMFGGVLVIAFPTVILSATFHEAYSTRLTYMTLQKIAQMNGRLVSLRRRRGGSQAAAEAAQQDVATQQDRAIAGKWKRRHTFFSSKTTTLALEDSTRPEGGGKLRREVIFFEHHDAFMEAYDMSAQSVSRPPLECEFANPNEFDRNLVRIRKEKEDLARRRQEKERLRRQRREAQAQRQRKQQNVVVDAPEVVSHDPLLPPPRAHTSGAASSDATPGSGPLSPDGESSPPAASRSFHSFRGERYGSMRKLKPSAPTVHVSTPKRDATSASGTSSDGEGAGADDTPNVGKNKKSMNRSKVEKAPSFEVLETEPTKPSPDSARPAPPIEVDPVVPAIPSQSATPTGATQPQQAPLLTVEASKTWDLPGPNPVLDYCTNAVGAGGRGADALSASAKEAHEAMQRRLQSIVDGSHITNRGAQCQDVVINGVLFYAPVLQLQCVALTNIVKARVVKTYPAGYTLTVNLILDSEVVRSVYEAQYVPKKLRRTARRGAGEIDGKAVQIRSKRRAGAKKAGGAPSEDEADDQTRLVAMGRRLQRAARRMGTVHAVAVKKLKSLKVMLTHQVPLPQGQLVSSCYMAVDQFDEPQTSSLPLTVVAPTKEAFMALVENFELLTFQFAVEYDAYDESKLDFGDMQIRSVVRTKEGAGTAVGGASMRLSASRRASAVSFAEDRGDKENEEVTLAHGDGTSSNPFSVPPAQESPEGFRSTGAFGA